MSFDLQVTAWESMTDEIVWAAPWTSSSRFEDLDIVYCEINDFF